MLVKITKATKTCWKRWSHIIIHLKVTTLSRVSHEEIFLSFNLLHFVEWTIYLGLASIEILKENYAFKEFRCLLYQSDIICWSSLICNRCVLSLNFSEYVSELNAISKHPIYKRFYYAWYSATFKLQELICRIEPEVNQSKRAVSYYRCSPVALDLSEW